MNRLIPIKRTMCLAARAATAIVAVILFSSANVKGSDPGFPPQIPQFETGDLTIDYTYNIYGFSIPHYQMNSWIPCFSVETWYLVEEVITRNKNSGSVTTSRTKGYNMNWVAERLNGGSCYGLFQAYDTTDVGAADQLLHGKLHWYDDEWWKIVYEPCNPQGEYWWRFPGDPGGIYGFGPTSYSHIQSGANTDYEVHSLGDQDNYWQKMDGWWKEISNCPESCNDSGRLIPTTVIGSRHRFELNLKLISGITPPTLPSVSYQDYLPKSGPILEGTLHSWNGNGSATDNSGSANGTASSGLVYDQGLVDQAFVFDGIDDVVDFGTSAGNFGANDFTAEFWVLTESHNNGAVFNKRATCGLTNMLDLRCDTGGRMIVEICEDTSGTDYVTLQSQGGINDGEYHHIALVRNGNLISFYIDGVLDSSVTATNIASVQNSAPFRLGGSPCMASFDGYLDEFALYNRALTADEIHVIFAAASQGKMFGSGPSIVSHPANRTHQLGQTLVLSVSVSGTDPFFYQWTKNGIPLEDGGNISGANSSVLTLSGVAGTDAGSYAVVVENGKGAVTSSTATVAVVSQPAISTKAVPTSTGFEVQVTGAVGASINLEYSANLANWTYLATSTIGSSGTNVYNDSFSSGLTERFYRAVPSGSNSCVGDVVGWVKKTAQPGYAVFGNQLLNGNNTLNEVITNVPVESVVLTYANNDYVTDIFDGTNWLDSSTGNPSATTLPVGTGFFFYNPQTNAVQVPFYGKVKTGTLDLPLPAGYSLVSVMTPQSLELTAANGFPQVEGMLYMPYVNGDYDTLVNDGTEWLDNDTGYPTPAQPAIFQGFFINAPSSTNWSRMFSICP